MHFKPLISIPIFSTAFLIMLAFSLSAFAQSAQAADYYVDCSASSNGSGTFGSPWNNLSSVNAKTFVTGDDVYFKVGTTCYLNANSDRLQVDWSGTGINRVIIGAYHGNGLFGLGGFERPIIDGRNLYPGNEQGGVEIRNRSYVTIRDLKIQNMGGVQPDGKRGGRSVTVLDSSYINTENCFLYRSSGCALIYARVNTGIVSGNIVENSKFPDYVVGGAAMEITAMNIEGATRNILVTGNYLKNNAGEGIGFYKKVTDSIMEYNIIRDNRTFYYYIDAGKNNTIRYNVAYKSTENHVASNRSYAIAVTNEDQRKYLFSEGNKVYGNMIAGASTGISLGCEIHKTIPNAVCHNGAKVYHNTIVDSSVTNIAARPTTGQTLEIKNNLSIFYGAPSTARHYFSWGGLSSTTTPGITWSHNLWYGGTLPTGNPRNNSVTGDPKLVKQAGWLTIAPDSLTANHFKLLSGSAAIDKGTALVSPYNIDYFKTPRPQGSGWDIGAHEFTTGPVTPFCGDGVCNGTETPSSCPVDCTDGSTPPPPSPGCTDNDGDRHIVENNPDFASCGTVCGPSKNQSCQGYNDCNDNNPKIYYGALNICNTGTDESCGRYADTCFCADGTEKNKCASNPPWQCNSEGVLTENCKVCGCQNSWSCGPFGAYCLPPKAACGNNICESELGESCGDCAKDCGRCPTSLTPGSHTITLLAMDARGNTARHSITLNVNSDPNLDTTEDTIWPKVNTFSVIQLQSNVIASYGVVDQGGSHLNTVEIWRANDNNGAPGAWTRLRTINLASHNIDAQNNAYTDTPAPGTYWYGMRVSDRAGHCTTEQNRDCSTGNPNGAASQGPRKIVVVDPSAVPANPPSPPVLPLLAIPPPPPVLP
jgi:hypothetical protein